MAEKISIQIALDGAQEIQRQLADISKEGQDAFNNIAKAAGKVGTFENFKPEEITARLKKMGVEGANEINKIQAAVQSAVRLEKVVGGVQSLETAFGKLGNAGSVAIKALDAAFAKLGSRLTNALGPLAGAGRALGPAAIPVAGLTAGSVALIKFASAAQETQKALTELQAVSGQSFQNLSALSNAFARGGTPLKQFASEFGNLSEKIAAVGEQAAKQQAISKQAKDIANGLKAAALPAITLDERVNALLQSLSRVPPTEQWFALADIFKELGSDVERARVGKALGLSPESIATLSLGSTKLREMADEAKRLGLALDDVDKKNLSGLLAGQTRAGALFDALKDKMGALVAPALASFWDGFTARLQQLVPVFTQIASSIGQMDFSSIGAAAADFLAIISKIGAGWAAMISGQVSLKDALVQLFQQAGSELAALAVTIGVNIGTGIVNGILSALAGVGQKIMAAIGIGAPGPLPGGAPIGQGGIGSNAAGGLLGGRGTGTSDSNLAWVSRGEHIMPARAVAQPGVLALLEALRRSGGNLRGVLDGMSRFALGGMAGLGPRQAMAFAGGGAVGSMSHVTIQFPGLPAIGGLRASSDVVDQLHRAAALAQVRSGGRKPSRYS